MERSAKSCLKRCSSTPFLAPYTASIVALNAYVFYTNVDTSQRFKARFTIIHALTIAFIITGSKPSISSALPLSSTTLCSCQALIIVVGLGIMA